MFRFTTVPISDYWPERVLFTEKTWSSTTVVNRRLPYNWVEATNSITLLLQTTGPMVSEPSQPYLFKTCLKQRSIYSLQTWSKQILRIVLFMEAINLNLLF